MRQHPSVESRFRGIVPPEDGIVDCGEVSVRGEGPSYIPKKTRVSSTTYRPSHELLDSSPLRWLQLGEEVLFELTGIPLSLSELRRCLRGSSSSKIRHIGCNAH